VKSEDTLSVVARYFQYLNTENWEAMRELWHEDGELDASGARPRTGGEGAIDYFHKALAPYASHDDIPTRVEVDGGRASVDIHYVGVTHEGRRVVIDAHSVYEVDDGRIRRLTSRYDLELARRDLEGSPSSE
jgi:fatty-acyl-CoA synthase